MATVEELELRLTALEARVGSGDFRRVLTNTARILDVVDGLHDMMTEQHSRLVIVELQGKATAAAVESLRADVQKGFSELSAKIEALPKIMAELLAEKGEK